MELYSRVFARYSSGLRGRNISMELASDTRRITHSENSRISAPWETFEIATNTMYGQKMPRDDHDEVTYYRKVVNPCKPRSKQISATTFCNVPVRKKKVPTITKHYAQRNNN